MSITGKIIFFVARSLPSPQQSFIGVLKSIGAKGILDASRTLEPDRGWAAFKESLEQPFQAVTDDEDDVPTEYFFKQMLVEDAAELYIEGNLLRCAVMYEGLHTLAQQMREIPPDIAGDFSPATLMVCLGPHDIFECAEHELGHFIARATFSFQIFGYGTPRQWNRYRELVFELPFVRDLQGKIESIIGPVERCAIWNA